MAEGCRDLLHCAHRKPSSTYACRESWRAVGESRPIAPCKKAQYSVVGVINGVVVARPVRVALVVSEDVGVVRRAVHHCTSTWGGIYHIMVGADKPDAALDLARRTSVDIIYAVNPAGESLAAETGFKWRGRGEWGPFSEPKEYLSSRLLGPEICLEHQRDRRVLPRWDSDDPLSLLYAAWFGQYGSEDYETTLATKFAAESDVRNIHSSEPLPGMGDVVSPIQITQAKTDYRAEGRSLGFVIVDPDNPADVIEFWNIRACGAHVWPWPIGYGDHVKVAADSWLREAIDSGEFPHAHSGTGDDLGIHLSVWGSRFGEPVPSDLNEVIDNYSGLHYWPQVEDWHKPRGYRGRHPLDTDYVEHFTITVPKEAVSISIPLPQIIASPSRGKRLAEPRIVAADIHIFRESGLAPGQTFTVPNTRSAASLIFDSFSVNEKFQRPTSGGRVIGIELSSGDVVINTISTLEVFQSLLEKSGWTCGQSDNGRFSGQLLDLLGGAESQAGNQPSIRWVLDKSARTPNGVPLPQLVQIARTHAVNWPGPLEHERVRSVYPQSVVNFLLARKILRPLLPVKCPTCATVAYLPPEDLATDISCEMCSASTPLGLILATDSKPSTWNARPAGSLSAARIAETMPVMACLNVLRVVVSPGGVSHANHMLGLTITEGRKWACEVDLALSTSRTGEPIVVIGEVKSYRDSITVTDLVNLRKVQTYLRQSGVECIVLAATLRPQFEDEELRELRTFCEQSPAIPVGNGGVLQPVLPIVFTAEDLSLPEFSDGHPASWENGRFGLLNLAQESCRRNLGLEEVKYSSTEDGGHGYIFKWKP